MKENIAILLATYNSESFIREQIDSLLNQTCQDWILYVRDDCSTDSTPEILKEYEVAYPKKIVVLDNQNKSFRAYMNFIDLLERVDSKYYMFCDHDDVWLDKKVEYSINKIKDLEEIHPNKPIVVHTDMYVVDNDMNIIADSFWKYSKFMPEHVSFAELVLCNSVNGCTMLFNDLAKQVSVPNIQYGKMHDTLVAQSVAAENGVIVGIPEKTVLYRQHSCNVVGAREVDISTYLSKLKNIKKVYKKNVESYKMANGIARLPLYYFLYIKLKVILLKLLK